MVTIEELYGFHQTTGKEAQYYKEKVKSLGDSAIRKKEGKVSKQVGIVCLILAVCLFAIGIFCIVRKYAFVISFKFFSEKIWNSHIEILGFVLVFVGSIVLSFYTASKGEKDGDLAEKFNVSVCNVFYEKTEAKYVRVRDKKGEVLASLEDMAAPMEVPTLEEIEGKEAALILVGNVSDPYILGLVNKQ